jgi:hypothetical protein
MSLAGLDLSQLKSQANSGKQPRVLSKTLGQLPRKPDVEVDPKVSDSHPVLLDLVEQRHGELIIVDRRS